MSYKYDFTCLHKAILTLRVRSQTNIMLHHLAGNYKEPSLLILVGTFC